MVVFNVSLPVRLIDYGLRDYSTGAWKGGDPNCTHSPARGVGKSGLEGGTKTQGHQQEGYGVVCPKCGAVKTDAQIGLEKTPEEYVANLVAVFKEVWRVLRNDGVVFLNIGDSYAGSGGPGSQYDNKASNGFKGAFQKYDNPNRVVNGLKPKNLIGIPWMLAFALRADGWYLRSDCIWNKLNPMPESIQGSHFSRHRVTIAEGDPSLLVDCPGCSKCEKTGGYILHLSAGRPSKSHEYVFLLSKSDTYYYDSDAIREPYAEASLPRAKRGVSETNKWSNGAPGSTAYAISQPRLNEKKLKDRKDTAFGGDGHSGYMSADGKLLINPLGRNKRTVWSLATQAFRGSKLLADYVGGDGRPYKASLDCPIHGHLAHHQNSYKVSSDEPPDLIENDNPGTNGNLSPAPSSLPKATISHTQLGVLHENTPTQIPESIDGYKSDASPHVSTSLVQIDAHTSRKSISDEMPGYRMDLSDRECVSFAKDHNKQKSKTDHVLPIAQCDRAFSEIPSYTQNMLPIVERTELGDHIAVSNILTDDPSAHISADILRHNDDISCILLYCTCKIVATDHFAVMPEKLVEPCVLAGTSERGCCPKCGTPWARIIEHTANYEKREKTHTPNHAPTKVDSTGWKPPTIVQNGWLPSCNCGIETTVPCRVLDPFSGAGTVGVVCARYGRDFVGIDLNPEYIEIARKRLNGTQRKF